ncbi:MAG: DUF6709 family protein [Lachnospiraceae bacterium]
MRGNNILSRFVVFLLMLGAIFTFMGIRDFIYDSKTPADYNSMLEEEYEKGMIIEGDLYANLGAFEENYTTRNGVKTGDSKYNYLIPVGEKQYMGLLNFTTTQENELEAQADATFAYWNGETSVEPELVHFKGQVKAMDSETKGYLESYMLDIGFTQAEVNELILPYYIKCDNYEGWLWQIVVGLVCLVIGGGIIIVPILSSRKKQDVMFANNGPVNSGAGLDPVFHTETPEYSSNSSFASDNNETNAYSGSAFDFGNSEMNNTTDSHDEDIYNTSYTAATEEKSQSGLSLKLKDD